MRVAKLGVAWSVSASAALSPIVVNEVGGLVGVITPMDVLRALARGEQVADGAIESGAGRERHAEPALAVQYVDLRSLDYGS